MTKSHAIALLALLATLRDDPDAKHLIELTLDRVRLLGAEAALREIAGEPPTAPSPDPLKAWQA